MARFDGRRLAAALAAAASVGACGQRADWEASTASRTCVDASGRRVPDGACGGGGSAGSRWRYFPSGGQIPPVGRPVAGGEEIPTVGVTYRDAPGGVRRGGFGGTASRLLRAVG